MASKAKRSTRTTTNSSRKTSNSTADGASRRWSTDEDKNLKTLIRQNTPTRLIAMKLKRTEGSVRQHVGRLGLSLKPTNRSPYG
jgi:hypothetical protein